MELFGAPRGAQLGLEQEHESRESRDSRGSQGEEEVHDKDGEQGIHSVIDTANNQNIDDAALEALLYFLSDRRQKLSGAISSLLPSHLPPESTLPALHALPPAALHALPSIPFTEMNPEELVRMAQVVYTALMRVYLKARPVLVGSLCRIENWCDVKEVEGLLKEQNVRFSCLWDANMADWDGRNLAI